jgi:hypothetical protein
MLRLDYHRVPRWPPWWMQLIALYLKRAGGGYTYDTALRTEQKDTLCINNLSFPYREEDQLSIREMIKALAELVEEQIYLSVI